MTVSITSLPDRASGRSGICKCPAVRHHAGEVVCVLLRSVLMQSSVARSANATPHVRSKTVKQRCDMCCRNRASSARICVFCARISRCRQGSANLSPESRCFGRSCRRRRHRRARNETARKSLSLLIDFESADARGRLLLAVSATPLARSFSVTTIACPARRVDAILRYSTCPSDRSHCLALHCI
jgi:hypothetical protein